MTKTKKKTLSDLLNEKYGRQVSYFGDDFVSLLNEDPLSTGVASIDYITMGGFPTERVTELYGPSASGKTLLALTWLAQVQSIGGGAIFYAMEDKLNARLVKMSGLDTGNLLYVVPSTLEEMYDMTYLITSELRQKEPDRYYGIVADSVAQGISQDETISLADRKSIENMNRGQVHSAAMRRISHLLIDSKVAVVLINQIRSKVSHFGSYEDSTGGKALEHTMSIRLHLTVRKQLKSENGRPIGSFNQARLAKSKVGPMDSCSFIVISRPNTPLPTGILPFGGFLELMVEYGKIESKGGGHYEACSLDGVEVANPKFQSSAGSLHVGFEEWLGNNLNWYEEIMAEVTRI